MNQTSNGQHPLDHGKSMKIPENSASLITLKPLAVWITANCGKFSKEMGITDHLSCLLSNLYGSQEATVSIDGTTGCFQIGKRVCQGCILSPCLFNLYAEYIKWNAGLDEAQTGTQIARGNINNLRYADYTTLMAESKEELKSLLIKVKEESEKAVSKFQKLRSWHLVPSLHGK